MAATTTSKATVKPTLTVIFTLKKLVTVSLTTDEKVSLTRLFFNRCNPNVEITLALFGRMFGYRFES